MKPRSPRILIVKLSAIGDVVHTLPALNALRSHFPDADITWLVEEAAAPLIVGHEALDRVLISRRKTWLKQIAQGRRLSAIKSALAFVRQLRQRPYDLVLDFQSSLKGAVFILLARGKKKIGFGPGMEHQEYSYLVLNTRIPMVSMEMHALDRGMALLEAMGLPPCEATYSIPMEEKTQQAAHALLAQAGWQPHKTALAINPVAKWETKLWPLERFAVLADRLIEHNQADIFFTGDGNDRALVARIQSLMRHGSANLAGKTSLRELAAIYRKMAVVISTDTGPMHIAAAVGAPVVALFGPTAPWRTGPYGGGHKIVQSDLPCIPCYKRSCATMQCMNAITVEQAYQATVDLLTETNDTPLARPGG